MTTTLTTLRLLDVVALSKALPDAGLLPGQVGTIVETLAPNVYEVEFSDDDGQTYAMLPLKAEQLIRLHYSAYPTHTSPNLVPTAMSTQINQYGKGDNIAGDKIAGDKIAGDKVLGNKTQDSHNVTIENASNSQVVIGNNNTVTQTNTTLDPVSASLAQDLKALLEDSSQDYNPATERGQAKIKDAILAEIQQTPTLRQRAANALKAAGEQALIEVLNHPAAKITIKAIKAALEA